MHWGKKREISYNEFTQVAEILESELSEADKAKEIFKTLFNIDVENMSTKDFYKYDKEAKRLLDVPVSLKKFFVLNGVKYYLIPDFDLLKTNELIDLDNHFNNGDYIALFNILYRPLKGKVKNNRYNIEPYNEVAYFPDLPYHVVIGALDFFQKSYSLLNQSLNTCLEQETNKRATEAV